jgi:hypothetical protein
MGWLLNFVFPVACYLIKELTAEGLRALVNQVLIEIDVPDLTVVAIND